MKNWEAVLVRPDVTLEHAIATLNQGGLRIVIVVDEDRRLLGTVTDGDVRRALLRHVSLEAPVSEVMCATPIVAQQDWTREKVLSVIEEKQVLQLPVVDSSHRVIGLQTIHGLLEKKQLANPVFLMAGGFGKRLYPLTKDCPKPLLRVGDKPILELILLDLIEAGFHRFFISTHYRPEMIRDYFKDGRRWGVSIEYIHEEEPLGTAGALGLLPHDRIDLPMLMMNGDLLTRVNYRALLDFHNEQGGVATMCVREYEHQVPYGVVNNEGPRVKEIVEKPVHKFFVNAGIYVLSPDLVHSVQHGVRIDMPDLLQMAISSGKVVASYPVHEYWLDIGRPEDFQRAQSALSEI